MSLGRKQKHITQETKSISYYLKKHEKAENSISLLAHRDNTMKAQGLNMFFDDDVSQFDKYKLKTQSLKKALSLI